MEEMQKDSMPLFFNKTMLIYSNILIIYLSQHQCAQDYLLLSYVTFKQPMQRTKDDFQQ